MRSWALLALVLSAALQVSFAEDADADFAFAHTRDITKATRSQRVDIDQLINKVDFGSVSRTSKISTIAKYFGKTGNYRLDDERQTGLFAKLRIQAKKVTYGVALIAIGVNFGAAAIPQALR